MVAIGILMMAVFAGGSVYTAWPAMLARRAQAEQRKQAQRAAADEQAAAVRAEQENAVAQKQQEDRRRLLADPVEAILPTVIRGLDPVGMRAAEESAHSALELAKQEVAAADAALAEAVATAPAWYARPVIRFLVAASVPALALVVIGNSIFEFLMLKNVSSGVVAVVFAGFMPVALMGCAALATFGLGFHTDRARSQTQRASTVAGVVGVLAALAALGYLAPLRTAENHAAKVAAKSATFNSVTVQHSEDPVSTPAVMVDEAQKQLTAAQDAAAADARIQRVFGVGLGLAEVLFAEASLQAVFLGTTLRRRRRCTAASSAELQARGHVVTVTGANDARIQNTTTSGLEYLTAQGVPDPRRHILQAVADAGLIITAVETADQNVMRAAERPNRSSLAARLAAVAQSAADQHPGLPEDPTAESPATDAGHVNEEPPSGGDDRPADEPHTPGLRVVPPPTILVNPGGETGAGVGTGPLDDTLDVDDFDISA